MGEVRILTRCEEVKLVEDQGWDPVRIIPVDSPRELDECLELLSVPQFDTAYRDRGRSRHGRILSGPGTRRKCLNWDTRSVVPGGSLICESTNTRREDAKNNTSASTASDRVSSPP